MDKCSVPTCPNWQFLIGCKVSYDTIMVYCVEHAKEFGYCIACGFKVDTNEKGICKTCAKVHQDVLNGLSREAFE